MTLKEAHLLIGLEFELGNSPAHASVLSRLDLKAVLDGTSSRT